MQSLCIQTNQRLWCVVGALCALLLACSNDKTAGGGPTGTEAENALVLQITNGNGNIGAMARLRSANYDPTQPNGFAIDTVGNAEGLVRLPMPPVGEWWIELSEGNGQRALVIVNVKQGDSSLRVSTTLQSPARLTGRIPPSYLPPTGQPCVEIRGTERTAPCAADGSFSFDSLAPSPFERPYHLVQAMPASESVAARTFARAEPRELVNTGILNTEAEAILLEDFSDGDTRHRYWSLDGGGWWYMVKHPQVQIVGDFTYNLPLPLIDPLPQDTGCQGKIISYAVVIDSTLVNPWVEMGFQIGVSERTYSLLSVDSISFRAKGKGEVLFRLHATDSLQVAYEALSPLVLDSVWSWHTVALSSNLEIKPLGAQAPAPDLAKFLSMVRLVSLTFLQDGEISLDQVKLYGAQRDSIWK